MTKHGGKTYISTILVQAKEICPSEEDRKCHVICVKIRWKISSIFKK
jgi:hypothetical protein